MLSNLLTSIILPKYKLKKLRILSENCNLKPYFNKMLYYDTGYNFCIKKNYSNIIIVNQLILIHY